MVDSQFLTEFARNHLRFSVQRVMVDILATCMSQFTSQGLDLAIRDGWSAVVFLSGLSPDEIKEILGSMPSMRSSQGYFINPSALKEISPLITPQSIISEFSERFPQQSEALQAHPQWLTGEISKAKALLDLLG